MRGRGYKEVRYWVPDTSSLEFIQRISAEARALNKVDRREGVAEFLEDVQAEAMSER